MRTNVREPLQALLADTYSVRDTKVHENGKVSNPTEKKTHTKNMKHEKQISKPFIHLLLVFFC